MSLNGDREVSSLFSPLPRPVTDAWSPQELESVERCPICGTRERTLLHQKLTDTVFFCSPGEWNLYHCRDCTDAYLSPRPNADSIGKAYKIYYTHDGLANEREPAGFPQKVKRALRNGYVNRCYGYDLKPALTLGRWVLPLLLEVHRNVDRAFRHLSLPTKKASLLDIGCGNGSFVRDASLWGWDAEGLDPDPKAPVAGRAAGIRIKTGSLPKTDYADATFAAITMSHSIEHLHDPVASLHEARRILQPGGLLWVATPNMASTGHKFFGASWRGLEAPRHLVLFTPKALKCALKLAGFVDVKMVRSAFNTHWYYTSSYRIAKGEDPNTSQRQLPPFLNMRARLQDWLTLLFPQSGEEIIFTARKPG